MNAYLQHLEYSSNVKCGNMHALQGKNYDKRFIAKLNQAVIRHYFVSYRQFLKLNSERAYHKIVICVIDITNCIILYHKMWLHVSTNYMAILRPFLHIKPKLQLQVTVWARKISQ
jgi:hypothetical protein